MSCCHGCFEFVEIDEEVAKSTVYFQDGVRRIDYILAYRDMEDEDPQNKEIRDIFEDNLMKVGVHLERAPKEESQDSETSFLKLHVPWKVILRYAERMKLKLPLREDKPEYQHHHNAKSDDCCCCSYKSFKKVMYCGGCCYINNTEKEEAIHARCQSDNYTAVFERDLIESFDIKSQDEFINDTVRSRIAYRIMNEARHGTSKLDVGVQHLLTTEAYIAAYPLHDGTFKHGTAEEDLTRMNIREILYCEWARWGKWYKFQPLDLIRRYLGDKFALYFVWLGFYTKMLFYASFLGLLVFVYSGITLNRKPTVKEICDSDYPTYAGDTVMCPLCDGAAGCTYWNLTTTCLSAQITYIFDNEATLAFAIIMALWATMFLEFWKRRQFELNYEWDLVDYDEERDLLRPEYAAAVPREKLNPITMKMEPYLSTKDRYQRLTFSSITVLFAILVVLAAVISVIVYRVFINQVFASSIDYSTIDETVGSLLSPSMLTTITGSTISLIVIQILNVVYEKVAIWLTNMELPRTQSEFEDKFTLKMFCFQFVNYYSYLFYVAFVKDAVAGTPGHYSYIGDARFEQCDAAGCMYELSFQLMITLVGKQILNNMQEIFLPWILNKWRQKKSVKTTETTGNVYTRWEQDFDLAEFKNMPLFYEYLEMVIQFGFVTLFVCAFPAAPLFALINNIIEIRLDANKFIAEYRRPVAQVGYGIGIWYDLLEFIGTLAVVTNAFTIAFTSETVPKLVYYYAYGSNSYVNFTSFSLSTYAISDFTTAQRPSDNPNGYTECKYRGYFTGPTDPNPYEHNTEYWHIYAARLAFVVVMEHVVFVLKKALDWIIPDRSRSLNEKIKREHFLVQEMLVEAETKKIAREMISAKEPQGRKSVVDEQPPSIFPPLYKEENETDAKKKADQTEF